MSTRSQIIVIGSDKIVTFYRHYDGYPTGVFADLLKVLPIVKAKDFVLEGCEIEHSRRAKRFKPEKDMIDAWDIEWSYIIDLKGKNIIVSKGDFKIGPVCSFTPTNPLEYVKELLPECQNREKITTIDLLSKLALKGYSINPKI